MLILWPILWIVFMLSLVIVVVVAAVRENAAKAKAAKQMMASQPQMMPIDTAPAGEAGGSQDLFAQSGFDDPNAGVEFAAFDENAFK